MDRYHYNKPLNIEPPLSPDDDEADLFCEGAYQDFIDQYDPEHEGTEDEVGWIASELCNICQVLKHDKTGRAIKEVFEAAREVIAAENAESQFTDISFQFDFEAETEGFKNKLRSIARYHELGKDNQQAA